MDPKANNWAHGNPSCKVLSWFWSINSQMDRKGYRSESSRVKAVDLTKNTHREKDMVVHACNPRTRKVNRGG